MKNTESVEGQGRPETSRIHVKLEKFKRGRSPSLHLAKEGDFARNPFCDINFVHQHSNSGWYFENDEIFPPYKGLQLIIWCITCYYCTLWILCRLSNAFSWQNSIQFTLFKEKMIGPNKKVCVFPVTCPKKLG